ncbi:MAG TPA: low temperature requirement protein A [Micromonosporaceae bacterium]|nr:low temperature requirement protein A [Micromonosporaceae bacterium]
MNDEQRSATDPTGLRQNLRDWFLRPPRPHGQVIAHRTVSFLELFYDLVYVVLIARTAHHLAEHVSWAGITEFAIVFALIWVVWFNGTLYQELHGREDGRSRTFIFVQVLLLAILAVYAADAFGDGGRPFALTYVVLLAVLSWQWYAVRRADEPRYRRLTGFYLAGMLVGTAVVAASVPLPAHLRPYVWAAFVIGSVAGGTALLVGQEAGALGVTVTDSLVERFGLFTIIVLGEVVVGVVDGLSESDRTGVTVATGLIALGIGFGVWWTYFDLVGRRLPQNRPRSLAQWAYSHLPLTLAVAAGGAAMVSLVEHADDQRAPAATAWLLSGATATVLVTLIAVVLSLEAYRAAPRRYRPVLVVLAVGAAATVAIGWARPSSWILVLAVALVLVATWLYLFARRLLP